MDAHDCVQVKCRLIKQLYLKENGWGFSLFQGEDSKTFKAVGMNLPTQYKIKYILSGNWQTGRDGIPELKTSAYVIPEQTEEAGIVAFLKTLDAGIGEKLARKIYKEFGARTWKVIMEDPSAVARVKGVGQIRAEKLMKAMTTNKTASDLAGFLSGAGVRITFNQVNSIVKEFKDDALEIARSNPYALIGKSMLDFNSADIVGKFLGYENGNVNRLQAYIKPLFATISSKGHICYPLDMFIREMCRRMQCSEDDCKSAITMAWSAGEVRGTNTFIYLRKRYEEEVFIAKQIKRMADCNSYQSIRNIDVFIKEFENENFPLAAQQEQAVRNAFENQVTIITGGPGTGKSTVTKAILYVHKKVYGTGSQPILLAPTGKAARRLAEATGQAACTVHKAVGYRGDDAADDEDILLEGNIIIVDESSMLDQSIAAILLKKIKNTAKLVFVGDPDQLPSVGAGNILSDMIVSGVIPTTRLETIFRQAQDNPIISNSHKINMGVTALDYSRTFKFIEAYSSQELFEKACVLYFKCVKAYGIDNVLLLNPQRNNTDLSVDAFNLKLQELMHKYNLLPFKDKGISIVSKGRSYRVGDKIMQLKNTNDASNGDTGFIHDIVRVYDSNASEGFKLVARVEFNNDGIVHDYDSEALCDCDLAYCSTVHKAQGEEYQTVIMVVTKEHAALLKRNVIYTGITRAKEHVAIIGEFDALCKAIENGAQDKRYTLLADRLYSLCKPQAHQTSLS